jgi:hypothetical protein
MKKTEKFLETIKYESEKIRELLMGPRVIEFDNGIVLETSVTKDGKPNLKLKKDGQVIEDLNAMVPRDVELVFDPSGKWRVEGEIGKGFKLYIGKFKDVDAILSFLHELGHLQNRQDLEIISKFRYISSKERSLDVLNEYPKSRLRALADEKKWVIKSERDAWAFALKQARQLEKKHGIRIFERLKGEKNAPNWKKASDWINSFLGKYEENFLDELYDLDIYTKEEMEEFFESLTNQS